MKIYMAELINYNHLIPTGLHPTYQSVDDFIKHLNELHPYLIQTLAYFIKNLLYKYNISGSTSINWDCKAKGIVIGGKKNIRQLSSELGLLNNKAKIMFMVAINYLNQINKRKCCNIILDNLRFKVYWGATVTISDNLNNGSDNNNLIKNKKDVKIKASGSGSGNSGGAKSNNPENENPKPYYYSFSETGTTDFTYAEQNSAGTQGRYIDIHEVDNMNLQVLTDPYTGLTFEIIDYTQLIEINFDFYVGNGSNGYDKPDVHTWLTGGYTRRAENLSVIFYDDNNNDIYEHNVWDTVKNRSLDGSLPPSGTVISNVYTKSTFTSVKLTQFHFGHILDKVKGFRFQQHRHTSILDNYAISNINLKFRY